MKFLFPRAVSFIVTALCALHSMTSAQRHIVIPRPVEEKYSTGSFILDRKTEIATISSNQELAPVAEYLGNFLEKGTGFVLPSLANGNPPKSNYILLEQDASLGNEGYELTVQKGSVRLRGGDQAGVFYAVQSLLQIMPPEIFRRDGLNKVAWKIPCATIIDKPRFPWRGMHLDVCRHFFPIEFVKRYIDFLAIYKMNTFHWHLTDDQGWRIEIKRYPKLTEVGGWRNGSMVGPYYNMKFDTIRYGGFFTQAQIREVVAYAASRYITVVPEIEMPGHALAALASYPELSCTGGPFEVGKAWGVFDDVFCPKETTFTFLENVLSEVCELFPGKYIHVGGDECPKVRWKECSSCQDLMKKEGLKDEEQLQSYFVSRIEKFLNTKGKNIIGWDEILQGGLAPNASVMSWRGTEGGIAAAKQHHNVVMTPGDYCYFDHYQGNPKYQPLAIGGYTTVEKVYWYDPVPSQLKPAERKYILGAQGNLWAEYITTPQQMEYMALPRMAALAEVDWSLPKNKNYQEFRGRLIRHFKVLDYVGANYSKALY
ncbi:MAG TPA: beta-N-acetylhexosaminidase, partial [Bacteroidota bacterium]|nr:beta-N-acetylhexosaminidase [Bacteroidota bacterium]